MTHNEEAYLHLEECIKSLNEAWCILEHLKTASLRPEHRAAAYRYALIAYARPYTNSDGKYNNRKKRNAYRLEKLKLSEEDLSLHQHILQLRDQILAHSDLTIKEATVHVYTIEGAPKTVICSNTLRNFPDINLVFGLIQRSLDLLYKERSQRLEQLAPPKT